MNPPKQQIYPNEKFNEKTYLLSTSHEVDMV
jgi:hypothetical protein